MHQGPCRHHEHTVAGRGQPVQGADAPRGDVLVWREQVVGQGFPVWKRQQFQAVLADGRAIFLSGQAEEKAHGLFQADGIVGAAGDDQGQALVGAGAFTDGQRVTAAVQLAPKAMIGRPGWKLRGDQGLGWRAGGCTLAHGQSGSPAVDVREAASRVF